MPEFAWRPFLERFSREVLADRRERKDLAPEIIESGWLGFPPAKEKEIKELEKRLGKKLPPSYRNFLLTSNGWRNAGSFVYDMLPVEKVTWFRDSHQEWIDSWVDGAGGEWAPVSDEEYFVYGEDQRSENFRLEYWQASLAISGIGDDAIYLLNPMVVSEEGEWEAWFFANWNTGVTRYRSLPELMQHELETLIRLRDNNERRYFPEDGLDSLRPKLPSLVARLQEKIEEGRKYRKPNEGPRRNWSEVNADGQIAGLTSATKEVQKIVKTADAQTPKALLKQLAALSKELKRKWKKDNRSDSNEKQGKAQGYSTASSIIDWFLNQPQ